MIAARLFQILDGAIEDILGELPLQIEALVFADDLRKRRIAVTRRSHLDSTCGAAHALRRSSLQAHELRGARTLYCRL